MKNKKGELTTQQIVLLIILIMSFVVILYFLIGLNIGETSEKEICHNSVVMKGNPVLSKGDVSLNCQRTYVCLTKDGSCEQMTNPNIRKVESKSEVYRVLADEMADCWWMFGEGKVDYIGGKFTEVNYCSICTQLAFDDSIKEIPEFEESKKIDKDDFYNYLANTPVSEGRETYAEYFLGTKDISKIKQEVQEADTFGTIDLDKHYFVMMGIVSELGGFQEAIGLGALSSIATIYTGLGGGIIVFLVAQEKSDEILEELRPEIGAIIVSGDGIDNEFMAPTIIEANSDKFKLLKCKDILTVA